MAGGLVRTQELLIAFALNLDQVRHLHHFVNVAEDLADPLLRRARYLAGRAGPGAFRLGRHGGNSPLSICAAAELVRPGVKICSSLAREGPRMRREKAAARSEEHTSELQSLMSTSYAVFCLKKKTKKK